MHKVGKLRKKCEESVKKVGINFTEWGMRWENFWEKSVKKLGRKFTNCETGGKKVGRKFTKCEDLEKKVWRKCEESGKKIHRVRKKWEKRALNFHKVWRFFTKWENSSRTLVWKKREEISVNFQSSSTVHVHLCHRAGAPWHLAAVLGHVTPN